MITPFQTQDQTKERLGLSVLFILETHFGNIFGASSQIKFFSRWLDLVSAHRDNTIHTKVNAVLMM